MSSIRYELKQDDILYFLHIPKTAGTTLITILENNFDFNSILHEYLWKNLLKNMPINFSKYKLIRGHFTYRIYRILPKKPVYMTMLRNPVDHIISLYEYIKLTSTNVEMKNFLSKPLNEILNDVIFKLQFLNPQTRQIGWDLDDISFNISLASSDFGNSPLPVESQIYMSNNRPSDKILLDSAKKHLSEFKFFGLVERFEESMFLLSYTFGWIPVKNTPKKNVTPNRPSISNIPQDTINRISKASKLDMELYSFAEEIFRKRFEQMVYELKEQYYEPRFASMSFYDMIYEMLEKHYEQNFEKKKEMVYELNYDFSQPLLGTGWHDREIIPNTGTIIRWTGPTTISTIDLPLLKNSDLVIQFHIVSQMSKDILKSLILEVNGYPVGIETSSQENGMTIFKGKIAEKFLKNGKSYTRLAFKVNRTISPHSIDSSTPDTRLLGVAFERIIISRN